MDKLVSFLDWQNLIFLLPGGFSVIILLISMVSGIGAGHDVDHDVDHDVEHDMAAHDVDMHHDVHHDAKGGIFVKALGFIGFGRIPLMIFLVTLGLSYTVAGLVLYRFFTYNIVDSFFMALALAVSVTGAFSKMMARYVPKSESYGMKRMELIGKEGEVRYTVDKDNGTVTILDRHGNLQQIECKAGSKGLTIAPGAKVTVEGWDDTSSQYTVNQNS